MYLVLCFSAGVGRAGTFCIIYSAICELNGTGNIGKNTTMLNNNYLLFVLFFFPMFSQLAFSCEGLSNIEVCGCQVVFSVLVTHSSSDDQLFFIFHFSERS